MSHESEKVVQVKVVYLESDKDQSTKTIRPIRVVIPETTRLANLLWEIADLIKQYVLLPLQDLPMLIACWVALTYCFQRFGYCGYLALRSATPRCGKTKLLRLLAHLVKGAPISITTCPTAAVLYRRFGTVLLLDEVDRLRNRDNEAYGQVIGVLNSGFEQGGVVERNVWGGNNWRVQQFQTYGPKALSGIEAIADTLSDRTFFVQMVRAGTRMPRLKIRQLETTFKRIREGLQAWVDGHVTDLENAYASLPNELKDLADMDDRFQDIAEPLVVLASLADAEALPTFIGPQKPSILQTLLSGLKQAAAEREPSGQEAAFLAFLDIAREALGDQDSVFSLSRDLLLKCCMVDDLDWIDSGKDLARFLKPFGLSPRQNPDGSGRGYEITRAWLTEWSNRYRRTGAVGS